MTDLELVWVRDYGLFVLLKCVFSARTTFVGLILKIKVFSFTSKDLSVFSVEAHLNIDSVQSIDALLRRLFLSLPDLETDGLATAGSTGCSSGYF